MSIILSTMGMGTIMTAAMMLPCALPAWRHLSSGVNCLQSYLFMAGYLTLWLGAFLVLEAFRAGIEVLGQENALSGLMAAGIFVIAGGYQFSSTKLATWRHEHTVRDVDAGGPPARLGARYAGHCIKENFPLMATMLVFGMMNVLAMALLTVIMFAEKISPSRLASGLIGVCLIGAGGFFFMQQL